MVVDTVPMSPEVGVAAVIFALAAGTAAIENREVIKALLFREKRDIELVLSEQGQIKRFQILVNDRVIGISDEQGLLRKQRLPRVVELQAREMSSNVFWYVRVSLTSEWGHVVRFRYTEFSGDVPIRLFVTEKMAQS